MCGPDDIHLQFSSPGSKIHYLMSFHLGKPILVMILIAACSGVIALARRAPKRADLVVWCFAESHVKSYIGEDPRARAGTPVGRFESRFEKSVDVQHINSR